LLAKYDTEIEGEKHDSFVLGKILDLFCWSLQKYFC
jgi:hypothetical protein